MSKFYPHLFSPLKVGRIRFRNRVWAAPTAMAMSFLTPEGFIRPECIEHFRNRALGGAAVVTLGESAVDFEHAAGHYHNTNLCDTHALPPLTTFTDAIHQAGAIASIEIAHAGRWALPQCCNGNNPIAPSGQILPNGVQVDEMTEEDMDRAAHNFAETCHFLQNAGFKMCLIHGAHTWLLSQFLSPLENHRKDKWGGSLENRARFPMMVLDRIRNRVGKEFLIEYRISGTEGAPKGVTNSFELPEVIEFIKMIEDKIDFIHISRGSRGILRSRPEMFPSSFMPPAPNVYMSEAVKKAGIKIPVIVVGSITDPDTAENIIAEGKADIVAMARTLIADPDWPNKAKHGRKDEIRPCVKCFNCLDEKNGRTFGGGITSFTLDVTKRFACTTNPRIGIEQNIIPPALRKKSVCIIGGGPAGMQAAITAAERGHDVRLFEKTDSLGGQIKFSEYVSFKYPLREFKDYLIRRVGQLAIKVFLNIEATPALIAEYNPDVVIAAVGSVPFIPNIPGICGSNVITAAEACIHPEYAGKKVLVIGGGDTGCETALHLVEYGHEVTLIEMDDFIARRTGYTHRIVLMEKLEKSVKTMVKTKCIAITDKGAEIETPEGKSFLNADTIVISLGSRANEDLAESFADVAEDFVIAGDAAIAKNVRQAIRNGYDAVCRI